jgi:polysaccharide pyruvyl transferase
MRIAVIGASNPGYANTGMLTVDLAAAGVLTRIDPSCALSWYTLHPPDEVESGHRYVNPSELPFDWLPLIEHFDEVCNHDAILLWGDFLQARHYFAEDAHARQTHRSRSPLPVERTLESLYRCLLFSDAPLSVLNKVIVFGSSILFNRQADYSADRYGEHLVRLLRNCRGVWAREPVSAAKIQHLTQDYTSMPLGTDSAFLLREEDITRLSTTSWLTLPFADHIGFFFGARTRPPWALFQFLRQLTRQLGLQLEWLPWFPVHDWLQAVPRSWWRHPARTAYILNSQRKIDQLMRRGPNYSAGDLLAAIKRYRFIVTDTYHLCVNAWRVGTPAICFGDPEESPVQQTLNDYKKRVLYEMYDAGDFHFSTCAVRSAAGRTRALEKVRRITTDGSIAAAITERIHAHARHVEHALAERVCGLVRT